MSGLILPGDAPTPGGLTILVPRGYETQGGPQPIGECFVCGDAFYDRKAAERHFRRCAMENIDELRHRSVANRLPFFNEDFWDPEIAAHMRRVGERMLREGRLTVKPSERAGF